MYRDIVAITPNDDADLPDGKCAAIWCAGDAGNVSLVTEAGKIVTLPIVAGFPSRLLVKTARVRASNTTATTLYACFL